MAAGGHKVANAVEAHFALVDFHRLGDVRVVAQNEIRPSIHGSMGHRRLITGDDLGDEADTPMDKDHYCIRPCLGPLDVLSHGCHVLLKGDRDNRWW